MLTSCLYALTTRLSLHGDVIRRRGRLVTSPCWQNCRLQRRFTKRLPGLKDVIFDKDRLERLGLEIIDMRRLRQDLVFTYLYLASLVIRVTSCS